MKPKSFTALLGAAALVACGGGSDQVAGIDGGGSPAPLATNVVSIGTITGFGSIIVNGVRYTTTGAAISVDGAPGTEADLAVGQVVTIRGTLDSGGTTGVANTIDSDDIVEGPISAIDTVAEILTVVGQTVQIDSATSFDANIPTSSLAGLNVGDTVEVSGFISADGSVRATRLALEQAGGELEVQGTVSNLSGTSFQINDLVVDFSGATLEDFPNGSPENGQRVEAKGSQFGANGELLATEVEFKGNDFGDEDVDQVELEGFITRFVSATDFDLEGIAVTTNGQTEFENGSSADLVLNGKIEVEGSFDATGVLVARKIEIQPDERIEIRSQVEDVQGNQLTVLGIPISVTSSTRLEDKSSANIQPFSVADLNVGDYVDIRGFEDATGVVATRLERLDVESDVELQGTVDTISTPDFSILGVVIQTNGNTDFEDVNDLPISATDFFNQALGRTVKADGQLLNGAIVAEEVELED